MSAQAPQGQAQTTEAPKPSDKELNFRALEQRYERQLHAEREARLQAEQKVQEAQRSHQRDDEEEEETEPYINHKKLNKTLQKFGQNAKQETQSEIQKAVQIALHEERKQNWLKSNGDFYDVLQHAEKFAQHDPELAETILQMPEGFERQKLVYKNIKALGLHKDAPKQSTIQEKIDANRKSPYYQPSGVGTNPYSSQGDYSASGQKQAYDKMQELKNRLRI
jgi:hypothetical protein